MAKPKLYYVRYLAPKEAGLGELVHVISYSHENDEPLTLELYHTMHPEVFTEDGFYTLMESKNEFLTVPLPDKKKKNSKNTD
jgi:hypothetical protein